MAVLGPPVSLSQAAGEFGVVVSLLAVRSAAGLSAGGGLLALAGRSKPSSFSIALTTYDVERWAPGASGSGFPATGNVDYAVITGGTAPYTFQWNKVSGAENVYAESPTSSTTRFCTTVRVFDGSYTQASFTLTARDAYGAVSTSPVLSIKLGWNDTTGGMIP